MRVSFLVNEIAGGWEPTDARLGGTEESVVRWAEGLVAKGHRVEVHRNARWANTEMTLHNSVWYKPRRHECQADVCINVKSAGEKVATIYDEPPTLYFTNEVDASKLDLSKYAGVIWPSKWAEEAYPVNNPTRFILPHGYDPQRIYYRRKVPKQCLYASSPDRGLDTLAQIWPSVVEKHPDAHLYVTYGGKIDAPNVTCGDFSEYEMNRLYIESEFWLHPANGGELFCISGLKAQAARCIPVYFPIMALPETIKVGVQCSDARDMYTKLVELMGDEDAKADYRKQFRRVNLPTWHDSTSRLLEIIHTVLD